MTTIMGIKNEIHRLKGEAIDMPEVQDILHETWLKLGKLWEKAMEEGFRTIESKSSISSPKKSSISIACDGACKGNPGPGGWAFVAHDGDRLVHQNSGYVGSTTNNRMELRAVVTALAWASLDSTRRIIVTVDSKYVRDGITKWIHRWKKNGWRTSQKKPVKNRDLWAILDEARQELEIEWNWVRGHSGDKWNEMADQLAGEAARGG